MTGSARELVLPNSTTDLQPDVPALQSEMESRKAAGKPPIKMVRLCSSAWYCVV